MSHKRNCGDERNDVQPRKKPYNEAAAEEDAEHAEFVKFVKLFELGEPAIIDAAAEEAAQKYAHKVVLDESRKLLAKAAAEAAAKAATEAAEAAEAAEADALEFGSIFDEENDKIAAKLAELTDSEAAAEAAAKPAKPAAPTLVRFLSNLSKDEMMSLLL